MVQALQHQLATDSNMSLASGINGSGGKSYFQGEIYEVMVFAKKLNDFAVRRLEGYLAYKWGGQGSLAISSPQVCQTIVWWYPA